MAGLTHLQGSGQPSNTPSADPASTLNPNFDIMA
jgi:hypothetical protein